MKLARRTAITVFSLALTQFAFGEKVKNVAAAGSPGKKLEAKCSGKGKKMENNPNVVRVAFGTNKGEFTLELYKDKAPKTVENFVGYVNDGFYTKTIFHRVIDGFMIQGGGFDEAFKEKKTKAPIENEAKNGLKNDVYTVAMARTNDPNSATAQFFVNNKTNDFLNYSAGNPGYAVFGKVIEGTATIDAISKLKTKTSGMYENVPVENVVIECAKVLN